MASSARLSALKSSQLKSLAFQCGLLTSGTKTDLATRIIQQIKPHDRTIAKAGSKTTGNNHVSLSRSKTTSNDNISPIRLLSIDMGIRNLAYCLLSLPANFPSTEKTAIPQVEAWQRTSLSISSSLKNEIDEPVTPEPEDFSPPTLSLLAYTLLKQTLLPLNPTHILIERQRFRSMGSKHILEWTIRVNTLEAMLYAILHTLKHEKLWNGHVIPILPGKVGGFWLPGDVDVQIADGSVGKTRKTANAKLLNKGAKIDLVRNWLEDAVGATTTTKSPVGLGTPQAKEVTAQYLEKWNRAPGARKKKQVDDASDAALTVQAAKALAGAGPEKLDDLADCLLQGMAWVRWEENKNKVLVFGPEGLDLRIEPRTLKGA